MYLTSQSVTSGGNWTSGVFLGLNINTLSITNYSSSSTKMVFKDVLVGEWGGSTGRVHVVIGIDGSQHLGWVGIEVSADFGTITITDYEYDDTPALFAGIADRDAESKPSVYSYGKTIHVKGISKGEVEVYNLAGQMVHNSNLSKGSNIDMRNMRSGIYAVKVISGGKTTTRKVFIE
ncbi:MAG: T9SS type A sorting domain-containing protein [Flavobacteriales bacterium]|nr:T9SS type A sorting domain-containing protein [Flavobacteriales bacterium]